MLRKNLINKKLKEDKQKLQLIEAYIKRKKKHEKLRKEKTNPKPKKKKKNSRIFSGVYQKTIPADTPSYGQGTKKEKSALDSFAEK